MTPNLDAMLRARSIALVGASARPGSFGARMVDEVTRSSGERRIHLVNPRYDSIAGRPCLPTLKHLDEPVDLVLLGVGDDALEEQLADAARIGAGSAVVFGSAHGTDLRRSLRTIAVEAGMALCGAACMGFVNVTDGLRAIGYVEPDPLPSGPIALVTHSGSVFSALLRTRRALGYTLAVSSGQELVTTTADYAQFALAQPATGVLALVVETVRDGLRLVGVLRRAAEQDVPVVILPLGGSPLGAELVTAHSGALAGEHGMWEALCEGTGAVLVADLAELTDTLELLAIGRRARHAGGIATVHDSGAERSLVADLATDLGVPFAALSAATGQQLAALVDDEVAPGNPLDLWGTGADTRRLFTSALRALADDAAVSAVALAVDLVTEFDGDRSYVDAVLDAAAGCDVPVVVLANLASAVDADAAAELRAAGVPVLEGTRSGLVALRNLLALAVPRTDAPAAAVDAARSARWSARLQDGRRLDGVESLALLAEYGIRVVPSRRAADEDSAVAAAEEVGYPVVLKTDEPGHPHKSAAGGVVLGLGDAAAVRAAYRELAMRLGSRTLVSATAPAGVELALGMVRDRQLGPLVVVAAGGVFTELVADRALALPPLSRGRAVRLIDRLRARPMLAGAGTGPDGGAVVAAVLALGVLAVELGEHLEALDVNPLIAGAAGAVAVDALVVPRH
jgi:acetate---CoA ligase (ADP-forming)